MRSGVSICTSVCRTTTLMQSNAPAMNNAASDSANDRDSPNTMIETPNPATAHNSACPALAIGRRCTSSSVITSAPAAGADQRKP